MRIPGANPGRTALTRSAYYNPATKQFAELMIDAEEDPTLRAVLVGLLREVRQKGA